MKATLVKYLKRQSFQPDLAGIFFNPFYFIRVFLFNSIKKKSQFAKGRLLDFGCGRKPYQNLFSVSEYIGVDVEQTGHNHQNSMVDVFYDGKQLPFADGHFDSVFCSEVLEHIFNPDEILPELNRVMVSKGRILITVPFCWNEHEIPYDYARYSSFGIVHLLEKNHFKIIELKKSGHFTAVLFQLWALYFFELFRPLKKAGYIMSMGFIIPVHILGSIFVLLLPKNQSLYFNTIIVAEKK